MAKDTAMAAIVAELETVKESVGSNSSVSCPTSTEYRLCQEEYQSKVSWVEFKLVKRFLNTIICNCNFLKFWGKRGGITENWFK